MKRERNRPSAKSNTGSNASAEGVVSSSALPSSSSSSSSSDTPIASSSGAAVLPTFNTAITKRQPRRAIAVYTDVDCIFHQTPASHPEKAGRVTTLWERLYAAFDQKLDWCSNAPRAAIKSLLLAHSPRYVTKFLQACKFLPHNNQPRNFMLCCGGKQGNSFKPGTRGAAHSSSSSKSSDSSGRKVKPKSSSDHDTFYSANAGGGSLAAALKCPGSVVAAVDSVLAGQHKHSFCLVRPPGHHCGYDGVPRRGLGEDADVGQGFCLLNNVAIAVCHALQNYAVRVAIIDIDLHHGNVSCVGHFTFAGFVSAIFTRS